MKTHIWWQVVHSIEKLVLPSLTSDDDESHFLWERSSSRTGRERTAFLVSPEGCLLSIFPSSHPSKGPAVLLQGTLGKMQQLYSMKPQAYHKEYHSSFQLLVACWVWSIFRHPFCTWVHQTGTMKIQCLLLPILQKGNCAFMRVMDTHVPLNMWTHKPPHPPKSIS